LSIRSFTTIILLI